MMLKIALVGNDGRANALKWHFEKYKHEVVAFLNPPLHLIIERSPFDLIILVNVEDSANGLQKKLVDAFGSRRVFACNKEAARFETDKAHGLDVATRYDLNIPQSIFIGQIWHLSDIKNATERIKKEISGNRYVIKKTGLACGQGVKIVRGNRELNMFLKLWNGYSVIVQEYKEGIEISGRVLCQQGNIIPLWMTMEHKRAFNDDRGPFVAEMGTVVLAGVGESILNEIKKLEPWLRKVNYTGMLDINFIMDEKGKLWFVEPTCRWGDPETEIAIPMFDCDFAEIALKACRGEEIIESDITFINRAAVGVVIAGGGYPYKNACLQGMPIEIPDQEYPYVFPMNTNTKEDGQLVTKGGRHLVVVGTGQTVEQARSDAYRMARSNYWFLDAWYRTDIGEKWDRQKHFLIEHEAIGKDFE